MDFRILVFTICLFWQANAQGEGDIRLADGNGGNPVTLGRIEVFMNRVWGTVCEHNFELIDARVVCTQLGLNHNGSAVTKFGAGSGRIWFEDVNCTGSELRLIDCKRANSTTSNCNHSNDVGVICSTATVTPTPAQTTPSIMPPLVPDYGICSSPASTIRLVRPTNESGIGVVQLFNGVIWGGVCDNNWDITNARIVCRSLCFDPNLGLPGSKAFNTSSVQEPMAVNNVYCVGNETSLLDCPKDTWSIGTCGMNEMARVTCVTMDNSAPTHAEPVLDCSGGHFTASFNRTRDPNLDENHLTVNRTSPGPCSVTKSTDASFVTIRIPFDECGTTRSYNQTHIIYRNVVLYELNQPQGSVSNTNTYLVQISCEMARNNTANRPILPVTEVVTQTAPGMFNVNMYFYRNNSFVTPVTQYPLQLPVGEWLFVALELEDIDPNLRLIVPHCFATTSLNRTSNPRYPMFTDKCIDDPSVGFFTLNDTLFGFRYQTFKFAQYPLVYIHCDALVCGKDELGQECDRSCFQAGPNGRKRRSVHRQIIHISSPSIIVYDPDTPTEVVRPSLSTSIPTEATPPVTQAPLTSRPTEATPPVTQAPPTSIPTESTPQVTQAPPTSRPAATSRPTEATPPVTQVPPTSRPSTKYTSKIPEITRLSTGYTTESENQKHTNVTTPLSQIGQVESIIGEDLELSDGSRASAIWSIVGLLCCSACLIQIFHL